MTIKTFIDRRRVLLGIAAASTAAASPAAAKRANTESKTLVALADALPDLVQHFKSQQKEVDRIEREVAKIWPAAPKEIRGFCAGSKPEMDVAGRKIMRAWSSDGKIERFFNYMPPEAVRNQIKDHESKIAHIMTTKSKRELKFEKIWLERMKEALPLSEAYCADVKRVKEASGYEPANRGLNAAREALKAHISAIMAYDPLTMEGVVIQAQAVMAWQNVEIIQRCFDPEAMNWPAKMAASVLAQGGAG